MVAGKKRGEYRGGSHSAGRRGQVTLFIILGIVLAIGAGLFVLLRSASTDAPTTPSVPEKIKPIALFTESCMRSVTQDGIFLLMSQGGYIDPMESFPDLQYQRDAYIAAPMTIPLWYYRGRDRMPQISDMEEDLGAFATERIASCLANYSEFSNEFEISADDEPVITVHINERDVGLVLEYPLTIKKRAEKTTTKWRSFQASEPTSLGSLYHLAADIMQAENEQAFLESLTVDMIASSDYLPYEGMEFNCKPKTWELRDIKSYIRELIPQNLRFLTFSGTSRTSVSELGGQVAQYADYYDKLYRIQIGDGVRSYPSAQVNAIYDPAWANSIDVSPRNGERVKPLKTEASVVTLGCLKIYHHRYSLNYPVMFQLIDTQDAGGVGSGEQFYFATPVLVKNNLPNRQNAILDWPAQVDLVDSERYCSNITLQTRYVVDEASGHLIAYPNELVEKEFYSMNVLAVNKFFGSAVLDNVSIDYQCVGYLCDDVGATAYPRNSEGLFTGGSPRFNGKFPACDGGYFIGQKDGFLDATVQQTIAPETAGTQVTLEMVEKKYKRFTVKIVQFTSGLQTIRDMNAGEEALGVLHNKELGFEQYIFLPRAPDEDLQELYLPLGDYTYDLDVKLIRDGQIIGGAYLESWAPQAQDVLSKPEVVFYATRKLDVAPPTNPDEFTALWDFAIANTRAPDMR